MTPLCINVIGAGHWGPNIVRNFSSIPGVMVGKVADIDGNRLAPITQNFPTVEVTTQPGEAASDPRSDAVAIVTPVATHFQLALAALEAGKHVFVEKPLCATSGECKQLIELAAKKSRILMVGHIFLFHPGIEKIKAILDSGEIGRIIYIDSVRTNLGPVRGDVNALWDLAAHDLAIFNYWLESQPLRVSATGANVALDSPQDVAFASVQYASGVLAHVHASWLNPRKVRQITVVGEKKMIVFDDIDMTRTVQIYNHGLTIDKTVYADSFGAHRLKYQHGDLLVPKLSGGEPLRMECEHFVECIRSGNPPRTGGIDGKRVVDILAASDLSLAAGGAYVDIRE